MALLRANGFEVTVASNPERVASLNRHWRTIDEGYETFVFGKRGTTVTRFWDLFATYSVVLFIKDGEVQRVWAAVTRTYL